MRVARKRHRVLALPGDGVGPEIMDIAIGVLEAVFGDDILVSQDVIGGASHARHGVPLSPEVLAQAREADAILLGAVGGPEWDGLPRAERPESGLLALRKELSLFANLRPAYCRPALLAASSLKPEHVSGLDIMIVRELTGGIYFGQPRGITEDEDGRRRAIDTQVYTDSEIERICAIAFSLAARRSGRLCSVDKANVMESGCLWREVVSAFGDTHPDIELSHMYADNCAMQLVRHPRQFDTIVTDNLFGDILSDCAAMLTGSLGMLPSASLGNPRSDGRSHGLFEPVHGSAPDIAGRGVVNPLAMILSVAMACAYGLAEPDAAERIEHAVDDVLDAGLRTADIAAAGRSVSTEEMGRAVIEAVA